MRNTASSKLLRSMGPPQPTTTGRYEDLTSTRPVSQRTALRHRARCRSQRLVRRLQPCRFRLRLFQDWDLRVCIFPQLEEVLIKGLSSINVALQNSRPRQPQVGKRSNGLVEGHSWVIQNLLEFGESCGAVV